LEIGQRARTAQETIIAGTKIIDGRDFCCGEMQGIDRFHTLADEDLASLKLSGL